MVQQKRKEKKIGKKNENIGGGGGGAKKNKNSKSSLYSYPKNLYFVVKPNTRQWAPALRVVLYRVFQFRLLTW